MAYLDWLNDIYMQGLKDWEPKSKAFDIEAEINHLVERQGYKTLEIPIPCRTRLGEKN